MIMFPGRFQTKAQDLDVDDHEVKVHKHKESFSLYFPSNIKKNLLQLLFGGKQSLKVRVLMKGKYKLPDEWRAFCLNLRIHIYFQGGESRRV